ncbi:hypothetical protein B0A52_01127 [Exophiala mesophila]|uniref:Uncharacterized protein n=1 Tax=Exophiala mesophila TaxID=212818 RepID=A0A438NGJ9_EXOME|nr:hypothetical protein B0A52_01127 [Exophiala mesophila]
MPTAPLAADGQKSMSLPDAFSLKGKVTLVTGGAQGIGLSLARGAAELGSDVAVLDLSENPTDEYAELEKTEGVRVRYYRTDVTDLPSLTDAFDRVSKDFGQINNCITSAGIVADKSFFETTWGEASKILNVNLLGTYFTAQLAAKRMKEQNSGGSIVLIASISAHAALPSQNLSIYGSSKGAVKTLARQLAVELGPIGIRVNSVSPGAIETELTRNLAVTNPELMSRFRASTPMGRVGQREELKGIVGYLMSDAAAFTTGTDILVTGGMHAGHL